MTIKENKPASRSNAVIALFVLICSFALLLISMVASIGFGASSITIQTIIDSILNYNPNDSSHIIIQELRIPRAVAAAFIGAALAVSGAIMQAMTRNPLASPSIMGVTAGAGLLLSIAFAIWPALSHIQLLIVSFVGAGLGATLVFTIASMSRGGMAPVKLALAGTAITTLLSSVSTVIGLRFDVAKDISFWYAGGVSGIQKISLYYLIPPIVIGIILALFLARSLTLLSFGDDIAKGLGQRTRWVKVTATCVVLLLTGAAVSIAGVIGFVGLVIPHITRFLVGLDYRWVIPGSALLGALLLVVADTIGRTINSPFEIPVGAVTAIVGVPFFLYLARKGGRGI
ncbi:FecCD family ABC transporter permease [Alkalihalobacillus pseudalcaliphilus]|uniref:FecCD family ABC transporter permease n=1 Tax=Alkalihalobacillus pseudalcaliphilus TaxID=79884 RepID=UPI00064D8AC6|nr:iron ABC transporter permease [Alkalihalobacillus pseudalcaliphilus]KMK75383.1 ferrichrome ABC transporter permease [Alkalihalobacillus pseudalcaliphilus]